MVFALVLALTLLLPIGAPSRAVSADLPVQGIYDLAPITGEDYRERLAAISGVGFKVILNYSVLAGFNPAGFGGLDDIRAYADAAHASGLQVIWALNDKRWWNGTDRAVHFRALARDLCARHSDEVVQKTVAALKDHPATWGYYVADEVGTEDAAGVLALVRLIKSVDREHPTLTIHMSNQFRSGVMQQFATAADQMGIDSYPVGKSCGSWDKSLSNHAERIREAFEWVNGQGKPFVVVLQAHDYNLYPEIASPWIPCPRWPSEVEMRDMRDAALNAARPAMILWYSYFDVIKHPNHPAQFDALARAAFAPRVR